MKNLSHATKIAVLKVLNDIVYADNVIHKNEVQYLNQVAADFGMSEGYKDEFDTVNALQVLSEIRELPARQKAGIASLMGKMITVDGDINYNEVRIYNEVCKACDIDKDFHLEDYPNYTLSGPFVNPEDL